jgi:hypothetical protein
MTLSILGKLAAFSIANPSSTIDALDQWNVPDGLLPPDIDCPESRVQALDEIRNHLLHIDEHLEFQREYLSSNHPEKVVAKYSHLFGS